jgi:capsular polysaccharide biosynthesis protein
MYQEYEMELAVVKPNVLLLAWRRNLWMILVLVGVSLSTTGYAGVHFYKPIYKAQSMLMLVNKMTDRSMGKEQLTWDAVSTNIKLITTYKDIVTSYPILERVVISHADLGLTVDELFKGLEVESDNRLQFITLSYKDTSQTRAAEIVNAVAVTFAESVFPYMKVDNVEILSKADPLSITTPVNFQVPVLMAVSLIVSIIVGILFIYFLHIRDPFIRSKEQVEQLMGFPVVAVINQ